MDEVQVGERTIAFDRAGEGSPVVFLHGILGDHRMWRRQVHSFSARHTVLAWDAPGCGGSGDPDERDRMPEYADHLAGLLDAVGIDRSHVVGLSWGGALAIELACRYPRRVASLVLAGAYAGWAGVRELPELRKVNRTGNPHDGVPYDGDLVDEVREHVFAVTQRWMDPDGDGDPADGVDGFRLDVAEMVPMGFWRDYRAFVKGINPDAALIGEIWWQRWPTMMMDPAPYLEVFDGVMHYRWYEPARRLLTAAPRSTTPSQFASELDSLWRSFPSGQLQASMSMAGSHDAEVGPWKAYLGILLRREDPAAVPG